MPTSLHWNAQQPEQGERKGRARHKPPNEDVWPDVLTTTGVAPTARPLLGSSRRYTTTQCSAKAWAEKSASINQPPGGRKGGTLIACKGYPLIVLQGVPSKVQHFCFVDVVTPPSSLRPSAPRTVSAFQTVEKNTDLESVEQKVCRGVVCSRLSVCVMSASPVSHSLVAASTHWLGRPQPAVRFITGSICHPANRAGHYSQVTTQSPHDCTDRGPDTVTHSDTHTRLTRLDHGGDC